MSKRNKNKSKRYNIDFRKNIVDFYHSGSSVRYLSNKYNISEMTIYRWIRDLTLSEGTNNKKMISQDVNIIQQENLRLKQELEILKQAMAILARK